MLPPPATAQIQVRRPPAQAVWLNRPCPASMSASASEPMPMPDRCSNSRRVITKSSRRGAGWDIEFRPLVRLGDRGSERTGVGIVVEIQSTNMNSLVRRSTWLNCSQAVNGGLGCDCGATAPGGLRGRVGGSLASHELDGQAKLIGLGRSAEHAAIKLANAVGGIRGEPAEGVAVGFSGAARPSRRAGASARARTGCS